MLPWSCPDGLVVQMPTPGGASLKLFLGQGPWQEEALLPGELIKHPFMLPQSTSPSLLWSPCYPSVQGNGKTAPDQAPIGQMTQTQKLKNLLCAQGGGGLLYFPSMSCQLPSLVQSVSDQNYACTELSGTASKPLCFQVTRLVGPSHLAVGRKEYLLPTSHRRELFSTENSILASLTNSMKTVQAGNGEGWEDGWSKVWSWPSETCLAALQCLLVFTSYHLLFKDNGRSPGYYSAYCKCPGILMGLGVCFHFSAVSFCPASNILINISVNRHQLRLGFHLPWNLDFQLLF